MKAVAKCAILGIVIASAAVLTGCASVSTGEADNVKRCSGRGASERK